jgi:hypothetical protein
MSRHPRTQPETQQQANHMSRTSHSYYVVMINYGHIGLEAVVRPEDTRRDIIDMLISGEKHHVVFIHHVDDLLVEDVTDELFDEAEAICRRPLQAAE